MRPAALVGFKQIKIREMLADDLFPCITFQRLSAGIPGEDVTFRIEDEDRIISYAFDEQTKDIGPLGWSATRAINWNRRGCLMRYRQGELRDSRYLRPSITGNFAVRQYRNRCIGS